MSSDADARFVAVSKDDIAAFTTKLAEWGTTLAPKEEALLRLLVERAQVLAPEDVRHQQIRTGLTAAVQSVYAGAAKVWDADPNGWVRTDPIWYKSGATDGGEQIDITVRITAQGASDATALPPTAPAGARAASPANAPPVVVVHAAPGAPGAPAAPAAAASAGSMPVAPAPAEPAATKE